MPDDVIQIAIQAVDAASNVIGAVGDSLGRLGKQSEDAASQITKVSAATEATNAKLAQYGAATESVTRSQNQLKLAEIELAEASQRLTRAQEELKNNTDPSKTAALNKELAEAQVQLDGAGSKVQSLSAKIEASNTVVDTAQKKFALFGMTTEEIGSKMTRAGQIATVGLTLPIAGIAVAATKAASGLNETANKIDVLFGSSAKTINDFANTAASALGQSKKQALDAAADFGIFGKAAGLAGNDLSDFAKQNVKLAADFASFYDTSPEEAITAIGAAYRGESEPIRRYGVLLNEASLKDQALRMGLIKTTTEALQPQARVLAAQALILQQTSAAQGDFERTSGSLANQSRSLNAEFQNMLAALGQSLLPVAIQMAGAANNLLKSFNDLSQPQKDLIVGFGLMAAAAGPVLTIGGKLVSTFGTMGPVFIDVARGVVGASQTISGVAGYLKVAGVNADSLKFAFADLKAGGVVLGAELAVIAGGLIAISKYLGEVDAASKATTNDLIAMSKSGDWFKQAAASTEILLHGQDRLKAALDGVNAQLKVSGKEYADYKSSIEATAKAAGYQIDANGNLVKSFSGMAGEQQKLIQANYALTESEYKLAQAQQAVMSGAYGQSGALDESNRATTQSAIRLKDEQDKLKQVMLAVQQGARNQADSFSVLDNAMDSSTAKANLVAASQKAISQDMADLKTVMAGALKNEITSFNTKQDDLADKAKKVKDELDKLQASQGAVANTTKKHGMTANEAALAQLQLAQAEAQLAAQNTKVTMSAGDQAAAQQRLAVAKEKLDAINAKETHSTRELTAAQSNLAAAQAELANQTDPLKQVELAVKVDKLKESLGGATGAVISYVDNSKKIAELRGQYDEINKEIEANAEAHKRATRTIEFGYVEQTIAAQNARNGITGITQDQEKLLDGLAVRWGLKSKEDIAAIQAIRDAMLGFAKDGSINEAIGNIDRSLGQASTIYDGVAKDVNSVTIAHDNLANVLGVPLPDIPAPNTENAHAAIQSVMGDATKAQKSISKPIPMTVDKNAATTSIQELLKMPPISIPAVIKPTIEQTPIKSVAGDSVAERAAQLREQSGSATSQAQKDYQAFTTGLVSSSKSAIDTTQTTASAALTAIQTLGGTVGMQLQAVSGSVITAMQLMGGISLNQIGTVENAVRNLPIYKEFEYKIKVTGDKIPSATGGSGGTTAPGAAYGADFIVPTGYPNDTYPLRVSSGERVTVQTQAQQAQGGANGPRTVINNNQTYVLQDSLSTKIVLEQQRMERIAATQAAM